MGNKFNGINLLKSEEKSVLERFLSWTLTIGRILVIVTEAIALGAFLYRFSLDMRLVDLKDDIKPLQAYVESKKDQEENFRDIQERLSLVKKYESSPSVMNSLYQTIIQTAKGKLTFNSINIGDESVRIDAITRSPGLMHAFISELKAIPQIKSISVDKVESKTASAEINFSLSLKLGNK